MSRYILALCVILLSFPSGVTAETKFEKRYRELSRQILDGFQKDWPVHATEMGIHQYDERFADYSREAVKDKSERLKTYLQRLHSLTSSEITPDIATDIALLKSNCEIALLRLTQLEYYRANPNLYIDEAVNGISSLLKDNNAPARERVKGIIGRMEALPALLQQGERNLTSPPPLWLDYARKNVDEAIALYRSAATISSAANPDRAGDIASALDKALGAWDHFRGFLASLAPGATGAYAIGKEYYDYILQRHYFLGFDADSLLKIGEKALAETQAAHAAKEKEYEAAGYFRRKPIFIPAAVTKQDVLDYYAWEAGMVRQFLADSAVVTVPADIGACRIMETPEYLRGTVGSLAYQAAGPFDITTTGTSYVGVIPDSLTAEQKERYFRSMHDRGFRGGVVHEVYPGHHLQAQLAARHPSEVRRWQQNALFIEGWALYCDEMMFEAGLYEDNPSRYLRILGGVLFRAARVIVDVKLQTGQLDYDQAVAWMAEVLDSDTDFVKTEVLRYTMDPGQAMTYLMGEHLIMALRDRVRQQEGAGFTLQSFHDRLLSEGSIPVGLIEKKLLK